MQFEYPFGSTPLDPDEIEGLIPLHITTQKQLNEWEYANILKAENSIYSYSHKNLFSIEYAQHLHKKMFDDTWHWAGKFRNTNKNIGVDKLIIAIGLKKLLEDVKFQLENKSFHLDEIAFRFHHRLVAIHPFANGNGRHARLMTDIFLLESERSRFSWGSRRFDAQSAVRDSYIKALKAADKHDYSFLAEFVRS